MPGDPHLRRDRRRRRFLWIAAAASIAALTAFPISFAWHIGWSPSSGDFIQLDNGHLLIGRTYCSPGWTLTQQPFHAKSLFSDPQDHRFSWSPPSQFGHWHIQIPLWSIFAVAAVPTFLALLRSRFRRQPNHCPCGYDLAGINSGICPECGRPFAPQEHPIAN